MYCEQCKTEFTDEVCPTCGKSCVEKPPESVPPGPPTHAPARPPHAGYSQPTPTAYPLAASPYGVSGGIQPGFQWADATAAAPRLPVPTDTRTDNGSILSAAHAPSGLLLVLLCWLLGAAASELLIFGGLGASVPILTVGFYAVAFWFLRGKRKSIASLLLLIPIAALSLCFMLVDSGMTTAINLLVLVTLVAIQLTMMSGCTLSGLFSLQMAGDTIVTVVGKPVQFMDMPFKAFGGKERKGKSSPRIVVGVLCAVPVAAIFIALFSAADARFSALMNDMVQGINLGNAATDVFLGALAAIYFAALFFTLKGRVSVKENTACVKNGIDGAAVAAFLVPVNIVQVLFVAVQFGSLFGHVSDSMITETARYGFFQLCWAVGIAALIICLTLIFCKRSEGWRPPKVASILLTLLILCNYVIFASSMYKMLRYIQRYDLTIKRVSTMWLMILFALCFVGALIRVWVPRFRTSLWVAGCVTVMALAISALNMDALIARYNVDQYLNSEQNGGYAAKLDTEALYQLSPAAAPEVARLIGEKTPLADEARDVLSSMCETVAAKSWRNYNIADDIARSVFQKYDITPSAEPAAEGSGD